MPIVSVILPTYNRAHLLDRAIRSVLNQTYHDFELIVVDDSTDNTNEVVRSFNDPRIRYIRKQKKRSAAAARNIGIRAAKGEYLAFQDSDDEWLPEKLDMQMRILSNASKEVGVIYTDMWRINDGKETYWHSPLNKPEDGIIYKRALDRVFCIGIQTALIRKTCLFKSGLFDESLHCLEDLDLFVRLSKYCYFHHINMPLVKYYATKNSVSSNGEAHILASEYLLKKYEGEVDKEAIAAFQFAIGNGLCQVGMLGKGKNLLFSAVRSNPLNVKYLIAALVSLFGEDVYLCACKIKRMIYPIDDPKKNTK
jgi:glycosyltransferase involved in cell wall biosynthesis